MARVVGRAIAGFLERRVEVVIPSGKGVDVSGQLVGGQAIVGGEVTHRYQVHIRIK